MGLAWDWQNPKNVLHNWCGKSAKIYSELCSLLNSVFSPKDANVYCVCSSSQPGPPTRLLMLSAREWSGTHSTGVLPSRENLKPTSHLASFDLV
jgi:hypothetical protein